MTKWLFRTCGVCGSRQRVLNGAWAKQRRLRRKITQETMADALRVSIAFVSALEKGRSAFPADKQNEYLRLLGA